MSKATMANWPAVAMESWLLGAEVCCVVWLRMLRISAGGPASDREALKMIEEKLVAQQELALALVSGKLGARAETIAARSLDHYGRKVRANKARLLRPAS